MIVRSRGIAPCGRWPYHRTSTICRQCHRQERAATRRTSTGTDTPVLMGITKAPMTALGRAVRQRARILWNCQAVGHRPVASKPCRKPVRSWGNVRRGPDAAGNTTLYATRRRRKSTETKPTNCLARKRDQYHSDRSARMYLINRCALGVRG